MIESQSPLLSPSDIADLAGVKRPVVSNWRKRHADFPSAVAGTGSKPLFDMNAVLAWLRQRGQVIESESSGARIWSALNAIRDRVTADDAADFVLFLATLKYVHAAKFDAVAGAHPEDQGARLADLASELSQLPALSDVQVPSQTLELRPNASLVVEAIARTDKRDLADAVDFVLERLSRAQIKGGAESGFVGSRTSTLLASVVGPEARTVYDPACGIANVLTSLADRGKVVRLIGVDVDRDALRIAAQRAFLRDARIEFLAADVLAADPDPHLVADVVVAEPPFGLAWDPTAALADPRFSFGVPPKSASDLAWVQHAVAHLAADGRAYVLTSPAALFRSGAERQIRANLLSAGCVEAIVALPPRMLPHTAIGLAMWVLRAPAESSDVLLIDAAGVDEVEFKVGSWLSIEAAGAGIDVSHARVPVTDLLAANAVLTPSKWLGELAIDKAEIASSFSRSSRAMVETIGRMGREALPFEEFADPSKSRVVTVRELVSSGAIELSVGRPAKARDLDEDLESRIVRTSDVRAGVLPSVDGLAQRTHPDLTEKDDVLVTTTHEVRAVLDVAGGHLPSNGVDRLRVSDQSLITPAYLAAVVAGSWNARLQTGTAIQRVPVRDLEVPLVPREEQSKFVLVQGAVRSARQQAERLKEYSTEAEAALLDALRYNVSLDWHLVVGRHGHDGKNEKDTK